MPKILLIIVVLLGVSLGLFLINRQTQLSSHASPNEIPKQMLISNIGSQGFTISWITTDETIGYLTYGNSADLNQVALDDRDISESIKRKTHYVTLKNLDAGTGYYFKVGSNDQVYSQDSSPLAQTTVPESQSTPPTPETLFGKIIIPQGNSAREVMVYTKINRGPLLSVLSQNNNWLINLSEARDTSAQNYITLVDGQILDIFAQAENGAGYIPWLTQYRNKQVDIKLEFSEIPFYKMSLGEDPLTANAVNFSTQKDNMTNQDEENSQTNTDSFFTKFFRLLGNLFKIG